MNIFIKELKANRKALIIWSVCMILLVVSGMGKYTAYSSGGASTEVFDKLPHTMKVLLGLGNFEVTKISGFYAFLFPYIQITAAIHAVLLGSGIIAKEERDKTTEFLIAKPISRKAIITAKLLAALVNVVIINIVSLLSSIAIVSSFNASEDITGEIILLHVSMFLVQLIYLSLGTVLAAFMRKSKKSGSIAINIMLVGYVISKLTELVEHLDFLNVLSPFNYFNLVKLVNNSEISIVITMLSVALIAGFSSLTYYFYQKRDMNI
ncbi:MAG: transporter, permease protein [Herbinix sp.]|jgi:ABC-2 type transport system permease protein|nr:transporter, permease protein [Herbinix sp.]